MTMARVATIEIDRLGQFPQTDERRLLCRGAISLFDAAKGKDKLC